MLNGNQWYEQKIFLYIKKIIMYDLNRAVEGLFIDFLSRLSRRPLRKRREGVFLCALFDLSTYFERLYQCFRCARVIFGKSPRAIDRAWAPPIVILKKMISFHQW